MWIRRIPTVSSTRKQARKPSVRRAMLAINAAKERRAQKGPMPLELFADRLTAAGHGSIIWIFWSWRMSQVLSFDMEEYQCN